MISRYGLVLIALAALNGPAGATGEPGQGGVERPGPRPARSRARAAIVALVPPPRPEAVLAAADHGAAEGTPAELRGGFEEIQPASKPAAFVAAVPPARPSLAFNAPAPIAADEPAPAASPAPSLLTTIFGPRAAAPSGEPAALPAPPGRGRIDQLIAHHARLNGVPEALVHRVVIRESRYNPRAIGRGGAMGLMQIKTATARGVGYAGGPAGLLDAETNLTYAVRYLAGAYQTAGGDHDRAVGYYARGYYYAAKRQGFGPVIARRSRGHERAIEAAATAPAIAAPAPAAPVVASAFEDRATR